MSTSTKDKLVWTAAKLFQEKGFDGVGLNEILAAAGLPKGSLYHHFPNGKKDLALEAAALADREMLRIINDAFASAETYRHGVSTLFHKLAKLFELLCSHTGCPISEILFAGPDRREFRTKSASYFSGWIACIAGHAIRLGETEAAAQQQAERLFISLQGCWTLARANEDSDHLRRAPGLLF
jgi:TetR/AcrR family transcriptional repressor of lmrAB and yxaGH operons